MVADVETPYFDGIAKLDLQVRAAFQAPAAAAAHLCWHLLLLCQLSWCMWCGTM